jgi:hypothetical protein
MTSKVRGIVRSYCTGSGRLGIMVGNVSFSLAIETHAHCHETTWSRPNKSYTMIAKNEKTS